MVFIRKTAQNPDEMDKTAKLSGKTAQNPDNMNNIKRTTDETNIYYSSSCRTGNLMCRL